ncbi:short-chain fatty acid transporter [Lentibacillus amyloliquefaciens]|uniref:Short-chain fatty acid transporter n=1 Tax=Lentibacillus amyloliquefaciens TaxID=1472767 RepID=A0A0U4F9M5_9BACI|nr:short-chain fatty acid transporter [Lentibacillus amyloliquefaciens]ALX50310.1 short-chain fatty acid transporter [Lentibacillus amyloliquefaciens]
MKAITSFFDRIVQRYLPDAFLFAIILTIIVFLLGMGIMGSSPVEMIDYWGTGFWDLLTFAMQMSLIVVTGYILASTPLVRNILKKISTLANTPGQAILLVTFVASIACLINYGFGLVVGALLAIHVARRVASVDYRLLMASAYSGFLLWHGGLSGSIPLLIATEDHFLMNSIGSVPVTETLFSSFNLFIVLFLLLTLPFLNWYLMRARGPFTNTNASTWDTKEYEDDEEEPSSHEPETPAEKLENSRIISLVIGLMGLAFIIYHFVQNGFDLNLNIVNFTFLFMGILFHRTPQRFLNSVSKAVKNAGGIIIQFPFYAGIMGMMVESGLSQEMSMWFVSISNEMTLPLFSFISAGIVNFFVPSGGGQWAVQGPIMIPAALEIGADTAKTAMGVAWGDAWTNMIQPFWALPLLAIAGLKVRDIMGFCVLILFYSFIPISIGLLFF